MEQLSVTEAAELLNVSRRRVLALIEAGRLPAEKIATVYVIKKEDLALVANRPTGRPKKEKAALPIGNKLAKKGRK